MDDMSQLSMLPSFPGGTLESKMCAKISELTEVRIYKVEHLYYSILSLSLLRARELLMIDS